MESFRRIFFPYCLQRRDDGLWVVLNRNYKPVGSTTRDYVSYDDIPQTECIERITKEQMAKLSHTGRCGADQRSIYLYDDSYYWNIGETLNLYYEKLTLLANMKLG